MAEVLAGKAVGVVVVAEPVAAAEARVQAVAVVGAVQAGRADRQQGAADPRRNRFGDWRWWRAGGPIESVSA